MPGKRAAFRRKKAARKIVRAIRRQQPEVLVGGKELLMVYFKRFLPALNRLLARKVKPE